MQVGQYFSAYLGALSQIKKSKYTKRDAKRAIEFSRTVRQHGIFFSVDGESYDENEGKTLKDNDIPLKPPYPVTVLEYTTKLPLRLEPNGTPLPRVLIAHDQGDHVLLTVVEFTKAGPTSRYGWLPPPYAVKVDYEDEHFASGVLLPDAYDSAAAAYDPRSANVNDGTTFDKYCIMRSFSDLSTYKKFCRALHENHVTFEEVEPDAKLNKMRRARGKAPLFTYKTLVIGKKKRKSRHLGGTHASPRSHLRRGYYRTSRNGVRHWVQPCMVKGETDGFVHKDYVVEGAADGYPN